MSKTISISPLIRIITNDTQLVAININHASSVSINNKATCVKLKAEYKGNPKDAARADFDTYEAPVVQFFFPAGTGLRYEVGKEITQEQFDYICYAVGEILYQTKAEQEARHLAEHKRKVAEFEGA
jgi:hypothetical protein